MHDSNRWTWETHGKALSNLLGAMKLCESEIDKKIYGTDSQVQKSIVFEYGYALKYCSSEPLKYFLMDMAGRKKGFSPVLEMDERLSGYVDSIAHEMPWNHLWDIIGHGLNEMPQMLALYNISRISVGVAPVRVEG